MTEPGGPDPNWRGRGPEPEGAESRRRLPDEVFEGEVRPSADPDAPRRRFNMPFGRGARERQEAARREAERQEEAAAAARAAVVDAGGPGPETSFGYEDEGDTVPIRPTAPFTGATPDEVRGAGGGRGDRVSRARRLLNRVRRDRAQPLSPDEALDRDLDEAAPVIPPGGIIRTPLPPPEPTVFERGRARVGAAYQATDEWGNRVAGGVRRGTEVTRDGVVAGTRATGRAARRGAEVTRDAAVDAAHAAYELAYPEVEPIYDALPRTRQWPPLKKNPCRKPTKRIGVRCRNGTS